MSSLVRGFFQKKPSLPVDYKNHVKQFLNIKTDNIIKWYDEFTGMGEVRKAQSRVLEEEQGFITAQNSRRKIFNELKNIQNQIKALNSELETTSKSEDKYLYLITQEHKLLKEEKVGLVNLYFHALYVSFFHYLNYGFVFLKTLFFKNLVLLSQYTGK